MSAEKSNSKLSKNYQNDQLYENADSAKCIQIIVLYKTWDHNSMVNSDRIVDLITFQTMVVLQFHVSCKNAAVVINQLNDFFIVA